MKASSYQNDYVKIDSASETSYVSRHKSNITPDDIMPSAAGSKFVPKCPTCGSSNIEKISVAVKIVFLGPFASLYKTFKCNNCKYKW